MSVIKFLRCITKDQIHTVRKTGHKYYELRTKDTQVINTEDLFWEAAAKTFPLNPQPQPNSKRLVDALEDSIFGGLLGSKDLKADIVWVQVDNIRRQFLKSRVEFFHSLATGLHPDSKFRIEGGEGGIELALHLVCSNDANRQAIDEYLSLYNVHQLKL